MSTNILPLYRSMEEMQCAYVDVHGIFSYNRIPALQFAGNNGFIDQYAVYRLRDNKYMFTHHGDRVQHNNLFVTTFEEVTDFLADSVYYIVIYSTTERKHISLPFKIDTCDKFKLEWYDDCDSGTNIYSNGFKHKISFEELHEQPIEVTPIKEGIELKNGQQKIIEAKFTPYYQINLIAPNDAIAGLYGLVTADQVHLTDKQGNTVRGHDFTITPVIDESNRVQRVTVKFQRYDEQAIEDGHCCDEESILSDPCGTSASCEGFAIEIVDDGDSLGYTTINPPSGAVRISWYLNGVLIGMGSTVDKQGFGTYRAVVNIGQCEATDFFVENDICETLDLSYTVVNDVINVYPVGGSGTYEIEYYYDESGNSLPGGLIGTGASLAIFSNGYYTIRVVDTNDCEKSVTFQHTLNQPPIGQCTHIVEIARNENTLTASMSDCDGDEAWQVFLDTGNGEVAIGSDPEVEATENGLYVFYGFCDDCSVRAQYLILDIEEPCIPIEIKSWPEPLEVTGSVAIDGNVTVEVEGCIEECPPNCDNFSGTLEDQFVCLDDEGQPIQPVTLTPVLTGGTAPFMYCWSTGEHTQSINVTPTEDTTYTVEITDANGCTIELEVTVFIRELEIVEIGDCFNGQDLYFEWTGAPSVRWEIYSLENGTTCDTFDENEINLVLVGQDSSGTVLLDNLDMDTDLYLRLHTQDGCEVTECLELAAGGNPGTGGQFYGCIDTNGCVGDCGGLVTSASFANLESMAWIFYQLFQEDVIGRLTLDAFYIDKDDGNGFVNVLAGVEDINVTEHLNEPQPSTVTCYQSIVDGLNSIAELASEGFSFAIDDDASTCSCLLNVTWPGCWDWYLIANQSANSWVKGSTPDEIHIYSDGTVIIEGVTIDPIRTPCSDNYILDRPSGVFNSNSFYDCD